MHLCPVDIFASDWYNIYFLSQESGLGKVHVLGLLCTVAPNAAMSVWALVYTLLYHCEHIYILVLVHVLPISYTFFYNGTLCICLIRSFLMAFCALDLIGD